MKKTENKGPQKPKKLSDEVLFEKIEDFIKKGNYYFTEHGNKRAVERKINKADVLKILNNEDGYKRKRNKTKDKYEQGEEDWNYCIEGKDTDGKVRIIISFYEGNMPIITIFSI